jgi:hypothetical protein
VGSSEAREHCMLKIGSAKKRCYDGTARPDTRQGGCGGTDLSRCSLVCCGADLFWCCGAVISCTPDALSYFDLEQPQTRHRVLDEVHEAILSEGVAGMLVEEACGTGCTVIHKVFFALIKTVPSKSSTP